MWVDRLRKAAVHESGHALMAHLLNWPIESVEIDDGSPGYFECMGYGRVMLVTTAKYPDLTDVEIRAQLDLTVEESRARVLDHILILLAGVDTQIRFRHRLNTHMHSMDEMETRELCRRLVGEPSLPDEQPLTEHSQQVYDERVDCVHDKFDAIGERYEAAVNALADALVRERKLLGPDVAAVFHQCGL
jgi:hypothetical protein